MPNPEPSKRPVWDIDRRLSELAGESVRVAAAAFAPVPSSANATASFQPVGNLVLPDGSRPDGRPVYFEGVLKEFQRSVAVVTVLLEAPRNSEESADGIVQFRGKTAAILRGPAWVRLSSPFQLEKVPDDATAYWEDLQWADFQFKLALD